MTDIKQLGEIKLIDRIRDKINGKAELLSSAYKDVVQGIGDDTAVIKGNGRNLTLFTADMLIENVHFDTSKMSFPQIGHKAIAASLSDIAAMGGIPKYCLVSIGLPGNMKAENVDEIYKGLSSLAEEYHTAVIGGDTNFSPAGIIIDVFLTGEVEPEFLCLRSEARPGDSILVTGRLGHSAECLSRGEYSPPSPRIKEARAILKMAKVNAMIDISDGLGKDLHAITRSSNTGAIINAESIPVSPGANMELALTGGEDYELLLTVPGDNKELLLSTIPAETGTALTCIGEIAEHNTGVLIRNKNGETVPLSPGGYEHFK